MNNLSGITHVSTPSAKKLQFNSLIDRHDDKYKETGVITALVALLNIGATQDVEPRNERKTG